MPKADRPQSDPGGWGRERLRLRRGWDWMRLLATSIVSTFRLVVLVCLGRVHWVQATASRIGAVRVAWAPSTQKPGSMSGKMLSRSSISARRSSSAGLMEPVVSQACRWP